MDFTNTVSGGGASLLPGPLGRPATASFSPVPFWGKRGLRSGVAEALAEQSARVADRTALEIEARIKTAYVRYYQADGQSAILGETLALLDGLSRLVETRYSVGLVPQQDAIRAHSELTALKIERVEAERRRRDAVAKLNTQLPRRADAPLDAPTGCPTCPRNSIWLRCSSVPDHCRRAWLASGWRGCRRQVAGARISQSLS